MSEIYSNEDDCYLLAKELMKKLKNKIDFFRPMRTSIPSGKYLSSYRRNNKESMFNGRWLLFYFEFSKDEFLRVGVRSNYYGSSLGEKLAALSDFYQVLSEEYGMPTVFYTTKNDDDLLNIQWSFIDKEDAIEKFKNNTYFSDTKINNLIVFDPKMEKISKEAGLPFELLYLVDEDIENYVKHKKGIDVNIVSENDESFTKKLMIK